MNRHFSIIIGLLVLGILFSLPGCNTCTGDEDNKGDVRCAGNILADKKDSSNSNSDNNIFDLIDHPNRISIPEAVTITDFKIFKTEVTNEQYAQFLKEKGARATLSQDGAENDCHLDNNIKALCYEFTGAGIEVNYPPGATTKGGKAKISDGYKVAPGIYSSHPVTYVSWYAAREFCKIKGWRLPTEKEWDIAAGTSKRTYPWGNNPPTCARANFASIATTGSYCAGDTVSVSTKLADSAGLYHMAGNVFEWTSKIIEKSDKDENQEDRVITGGAWDSPAKELKNSERPSQLPTSTLANLGFRCVK